MQKVILILFGQFDVSVDGLLITVSFALRVTVIDNVGKGSDYLVITRTERGNLDISLYARSYG